MTKNMFWPIYMRLEQEFKELSYYITIDKNQLKTYSIKIADLILRASAECENIACELCKKEGIKFVDSKGHIRKVVNFNEYIEALNKIYNLQWKNVNPIYENISNNAFDMKLTPFVKHKIKVNGKEKEVIPWYNAYNKIKHDRIKNYRKANMENLILTLGALFLLNIYYKDKTFYVNGSYDINKVIQQIEGFSDVFLVDYSLKVDEYKYNKFKTDTFFDPFSYFKIGLPMSVYVIEEDKEIKTDSDECADLMDKLESCVKIKQSDGTFIKKYENYQLTDHKTICNVVASVNKIAVLKYPD